MLGGGVGEPPISRVPSYHMKVSTRSGTEVEGDFIYGMVGNTVSVGGLVNLPRDKVLLDDARPSPPPPPARAGCGAAPGCGRSRWWCPPGCSPAPDACPRAGPAGPEPSRSGCRPLRSTPPGRTRRRPPGRCGWRPPAPGQGFTECSLYSSRDLGIIQVHTKKD